MTQRELNWIVKQFANNEMTILQLAKVFSAKYGPMSPQGRQAFREGVEQLVRSGRVERAAPPGDWPYFYHAAKVPGAGSDGQTQEQR